MHRILLVSLASALATPAALAHGGGKACILTATETITAPRRPNVFAMELNCGSDPDSAQEAATVSVANTRNTADALNVMLAEGYELEGASTMHSYAGGAIISYFTFVMEGEMEEGTEEAMPEPSVEDEFGGLDDLPEAQAAGEEDEEDDTMSDDASEDEVDPLDAE